MYHLSTKSRETAVSSWWKHFEECMRRAQLYNVDTPHLVMGPPSSAHSLLVELFRLCVKRASLLNHSEPLDLESGACRLACHNPWALLAECAPLLAHDFSALILHQVRFCKPSRGLGELACKEATSLKFYRDFFH